MAQTKQGIGILGGTFDPIHLGHTHSAQSVASELGLEKVLLIPTYISPHKAMVDQIPHATPKQRANMVSLACKQSSIFQCDEREIHRSGHSYTIDTLKELKDENPKRTLYFIIGMDSLMTFTRWHQHQEILRLCHLVVNTRPNYPIEQINDETKQLLACHQTSQVNELAELNAGKIFFAQQSFYDISSTQIRQKLAEQKDCLEQLLPTISDFIHKNKLYR